MGGEFGEGRVGFHFTFSDFLIEQTTDLEGVPMGARKCHRPTDHQQTDMRVHREVTLPIIST